MAEKLEVRVPNMGDISDVEILEIFVEPGSSVNKEDPLLSLETDKAVMEVPSPEKGLIESLTVSVGDKISEGDLIAYLISESEVSNSKEKGERKKDIPLPEDLKTKESKQEKVSTVKEETVVNEVSEVKTRPSIAKYHASPSVRKFARELGVDLAKVEGSGPKNRITREDVKLWIKDELNHKMRATRTGIPSFSLDDFQKLGDVETKSLNRIKRISGQRLQASWQEIPHVTHSDEADITDLEELRKDLNQKLKSEGVKITPLAFIMKAVVKALQNFPEFNSSLSSDGESLFLKKFYHIGFAADTPDGLLVPVVKDADQKGVKEIAKELMELSSKARDKKLEGKFLRDGSFTISSLGGIGGSHFTPIINPPEAAILGVSRNQWKPIWNGKDFQARLILPFSLSYDHRIIDGAQAARFCRYLAEILGDFRLSVL